MRRNKEIIVLLVLLAGMMAFVLWYVIDRRAKNRDLRPAKPVGTRLARPTTIGQADAGRGSQCISSATQAAPLPPSSVEQLAVQLQQWYEAHTTALSHVCRSFCLFVFFL